MKDQRSELRLNNEWWMFCIVSLSLIKSTKLLTCSASCPPLLLVSTSDGFLSVNVLKPKLKYSTWHKIQNYSVYHHGRIKMFTAVKLEPNIFVIFA